MNYPKPAGVLLRVYFLPRVGAQRYEVFASPDIL